MLHKCTWCCALLSQLHCIQVRAKQRRCMCCRCEIIAVNSNSLTCTMPPGKAQSTSVRVALFDQTLNSAGNPVGVVARAYFASFDWRPQLTPAIAAVTPTALQPISGGAAQSVQLQWSVPVYRGGPSTEQTSAAKTLFRSGNTTLPAAAVRLCWLSLKALHDKHGTPCILGKSGIHEISNMALMRSATWVCARR